MSIWKLPPSLKKATEITNNTLVTHLGIELTEIGDDYLAGKMPVDGRTKQPHGIMHGGASCVLAESLGSLAGNMCVDNEQYACVGLSINTNHLRMAKQGFVHGKAKPIQLGRRTQVWKIEIHDDNGKLVSVSTLTLAVIARSDTA
jgi:uncharacterized protein (TIGR00369 family)